MQATIPSRVLTGVVLPRSTTGTTGVAITVGLVVGFALLTAAPAQIAIPLPFTPVPLSGQTFGVILAGAALGSSAGASSQILYILMAGLGLPFWAGGESGWAALSGPTAGYLVGFVVAAFLIGRLAEHTGDREVRTAVPGILLGSMVILGLGTLWLARLLGDGLWNAAELGLFPFIPGDVLKAVLAGVLLPATWRLVGRLKGLQ